MFEVLSTQKDLRVPAVSILLICLGGLILTSPWATGKFNLYGYEPGSMPKEVRAALKQAGTANNDKSELLRAASVLIAQGRASGNSFIVEKANAILASIPDAGNDASVLTAQATATQYLHKFDEALLLLERAIELDRTNLNALLIRANILLVQGKIQEAQKACLSIARAQQYGLYVLCKTTAAAVGDDALESASSLLSALKSGRLKSELAGYAYSVLGEIYLFNSDFDRAQKMLELAQSHDPESLRVRMLRADALFKTNNYFDALKVLNIQADTDALLVRRAIAYKHTGKRKTLAKAMTELENRVQGNLQANHTGHAREEALFYLDVVGDGKKALTRANVNWAFQREFEDARLVLDAAFAAGSPDDAEKIMVWMQKQNVAAPELVSRLKKLGYNVEPAAI